MSYKRIGIIAVFLLLLWVGFIIFMSSQTAESSGNMSRAVSRAIITMAEKLGAAYPGAGNSVQAVVRIDEYVRDLAHIAMYFMLAAIFSAVLWLRGINNNRWIAVVFISGLCISIIDEINQMNYHGRNDSGLAGAGVADVFKDVAGICAAVGVFFLLRRRFGKRSSQKKPVKV